MKAERITYNTWRVNSSAGRAYTVSSTSSRNSDGDYIKQWRCSCDAERYDCEHVQTARAAYAAWGHAQRARWKVEEAREAWISALNKVLQCCTAKIWGRKRRDAEEELAERLEAADKCFEEWKNLPDRETTEAEAEGH